ncbi:unnamed protein product [Gongylonema pulchrum]|uniref:Uncharacterized protein n=1 Tax=Gongylonema pulchrum TaxID=637853 RepID=A0A183DUB6_9BILA|nr:unnamed protein product [Gongylonema pulchrum]
MKLMLRLKELEGRLADERRLVNDVNVKLKVLYDTSEQKALQEKWQIREERQKLNVEKEAFKIEQRKILDLVEQQRNEIEASRSDFLREQHDLLVRMMAAKSSLEAERAAFDTQRDRDVLRLKTEAEQLDNKLKQIVGLEQALIEECFELERCRKQVESVQTAIRSKQTQRMPTSLDTVPDFVIDPYTSERPSQSEKGSYDAVLKMHAGALDDMNSRQNLNMRMPTSLDTVPDFVIDPYTSERPSQSEKGSYDAVLKMHAGALDDMNSRQNLNMV